MLITKKSCFGQSNLFPQPNKMGTINYRLCCWIAALTWLSVITITIAYTPNGYKGCFKEEMMGTDWDEIDQSLIDNTTISGDKCMALCQEHKPGTRFAGTKAGFRCFCSKRRGREEYRVNETGHCETRCYGKYTERCGGLHYMSLYDVYGMSVCFVRPCRNGARCRSYHMTDYFCICREGFTGKNCEHELMVRWKGPSGSRTFYMGFVNYVNFEQCKTLCRSLDEHSRIAIFRNADQPWFVNSGVLTKDVHYWTQAENTPSTACYLMYNSQVTMAPSCDQKYGCLCQTDIF